MSMWCIATVDGIDLCPLCFVGFYVCVLFMLKFSSIRRHMRHTVVPPTRFVSDAVWNK